MELTPELAAFLEDSNESRRNPVSVTEAVSRVQAGFFKDRFLLHTAVPKSGSSAVGDAIAELTGLPRGYAAYMRPNGDSDLRIDLVLDFPHGGMLKFHTRAVPKNLRIIDLLGCRTVVQIRDPRDTVVALYCHYRKTANRKKGLVANHFIRDQLSPIDAAFIPDINHLVDRAEIQRGLLYLVEDGWLQALLLWIDQWLRVITPTRVMLITYEQAIRDIGALLARIAEFTDRTDVPADRLASAAERFDAYRDRATGDAGSFQAYPFGYTGQIGVWQTYMDPETQDRTRTILRAAHQAGLASRILDVYPDLLD